MERVRIDIAEIAELDMPVATYGAGVATTDGTFEMIVSLVVLMGFGA